jgi:hypothetical protein
LFFLLLVYEILYIFLQSSKTFDIKQLYSQMAVLFELLAGSRSDERAEGRER